MKRVAIATGLAACTPIPPPMIPSHVSTAPELRGTTTVMIVFGVVDQILGSGGDDTALFELSVATGVRTNR